MVGYCYSIGIGYTVVIAYKNTGYKNISVIRTFFSTPDDVLISDYYCINLSIDKCLDEIYFFFLLTVFSVC